MTPATQAPHGAEWRPNPGPQERFLASSAYEALYGGAAGGGKSESLLVAPLRWVDRAAFRGLVLRRTYPELEKSIIDRSHQLYPRAVPGARYHEQKKFWQFPSGARIYFGHAEHDKDVHQYQGAEFAYVAFDELTHFTEAQYTYLLSRARSASSIPIRVRAATNPGGIGAEWVMRRWGPWLDPASPARAAPGETRHYVNTPDGERWVAARTPGALSRVFVPARIADNPYLARNDPGYAQRLMGLDPVTRAQLLEGNWLIQPARGLYFRRAWLAVIDAPPAAATRVRYWDRAASVDGDYTAGVRLARTADDLYWVEDVVRLRGTPREVEATIRTTAELDGTDVTIGIEQDPGQAGRFEADYYVRALAGWNVRACLATGDKLTRAQPVSAQCEGGNVRLVRGAWNAALVQELEAFPEGRHDDQVDALSGAFALLARATHRPYRSAPAAPSRWS